jgi:ribonuclease E
MSENKMLIDAAHPEETRVVVLRGGRVEEFDYESAARKQLRGNIYLAKVTRVEPALQAAFVDYGGNRHGFLAFNEIHPDYYQIPVADRLALLEEEARASKSRDDDADELIDDASVEEVAEPDDVHDDDEDYDAAGNGNVEVLSRDDDDFDHDGADDGIDDPQSAAHDDGADESQSDDLPPLDDTQQASSEIDQADGQNPDAADVIDDDRGDSGEAENDSDGDDNGDGPKVLPQSMVRDPSVSEEPSEDASADQPEALPEAASNEQPPLEAQSDIVTDQPLTQENEGGAEQSAEAVDFAVEPETAALDEQQADEAPHGLDDQPAPADSADQRRFHHRNR